MNLKKICAKYSSKLLLYTAVLLYVFIFFTGILFYFFAINTFDDIRSESIAIQCNNLEESVNFELNSYQKTISMLLIDDTFSRIIRTIPEDVIKNSEYVQNYLDNLSTSYFSPITLDVYLPDDIKVIKYKSLHSVSDVENEEWMQQIRSVSYNLIQWSFTDDGELLCFCGLRSDDHNVDTYIKLTVSADVIFDLASKYTDDENISIFFYNPYYELVNFSGKYAEKYISILDQFIMEETTLEEVGEKNSIDIQTFEIEKIGFNVFFVKDKSGSEDYLDFSKYLIIIFFAIILVSLVILPFFTNMATRRLNILNENVRAVDETHLYYQNDLNGDDEFAELSRSFEDMVNRTALLLEKTKQMESERFELEFKALQEQINPHFLYNSLSAINALATEIHADNISEAILALARFYRLSLNEGCTTISVKDELNILKSYTKICSIRYQNTLDVIYDVAEETLECIMPKLILQPFIENSVFHGFNPEIAGKPTIWVEIKQNENNLILKITDNGNGIPEERIDDIMKSGLAISNIDRRLKLLYGEDYGVKIESQFGKGTTVTVLIPLNK